MKCLLDMYVDISDLATFVDENYFWNFKWYRLLCFSWCISYRYAAIHEVNSSSKSFYFSANFMDFPWFQNQLSWAVPFLIAYTWAKEIIPKYHFKISFCLPRTSLSMCATLTMGQFKGLIPSLAWLLNIELEHLRHINSMESMDTNFLSMVYFLTLTPI